jgi:hypothetical protein
VAAVFKPIGIPRVELVEVNMTLDEYEALRLADLEGLYQDDAAGRMGVSRATFGRILRSAHRKVAETLTHGLALRIEGGPVAWHGRRKGRGGRRCCPGERPAPGDTDASKGDVR